MDNNYVETVIALVPNLFFGTTIAVNILVLARNKTDTAIQFIDGRDSPLNRAGLAISIMRSVQDSIVYLSGESRPSPAILSKPPVSNPVANPGKKAVAFGSMTVKN